MDNLDDSENNAKISDSAYSTSCSNSQSRRSRSSKSTHSGSNSSGSSGYGGKPSTSGSSNNLNQSVDKRSKVAVQAETECRPPEPIPNFEVQKEEPDDVVISVIPAHIQTEKCDESMGNPSSDSSSVKDEKTTDVAAIASLNLVTSRPISSHYSDGFSCVISMHDGVVMYTTSSITPTLGFPKDMWIGRSFIDFVHPKDRNTFASQITSGLAVPKYVNGTQEKVQSSGNSLATIFCRIRRYRNLTTGFGVKDKLVMFMPFLLKLSFKNISDEEGKDIYLILHATPLFSAFKTPNEIVSKTVSFVIRHVANGNLEYIDPESVPYLGYLPQDVMDKDVLQLYHPDDLEYLQNIYETIVREGSVPRCRPYRMMAQNGDYVKLETIWSSFINPWSRKIEFVIGKHFVIEGPANPDVFQSPDPNNSVKISEEEQNKNDSLRLNIVRIMNKVLTKPAELAKQQMSKRCQDLASFMETLMEDQPKPEDELRLEIHEQENSYYERDTVMLGGISPHHEYNDSKSSVETPLSYNQLNYSENLQRYFDSHQPFDFVEYNTGPSGNALGLKESKLFASNHLSPMAQNSGDSGELTSSCESSGFAVSSYGPNIGEDDYQPTRLTESLLTKHNAVMEKDLVKKFRENRFGTKCVRDKICSENRLKKKEHLARCNASFQPTTAVLESRGVKRASKQTEIGTTTVVKHHCSTTRQHRPRSVTTSASSVHLSTTVTTSVAARHWSTVPVHSMSTLNPRTIPHQMPIMNPVAAVPGMFPVYYMPTVPSPVMPPISDTNNQVNYNFNNNNSGQYSGQNSSVQYMMYGQAVFGSPILYAPLNTHMAYPMQQPMVSQDTQVNSLYPLGLTTRNYEEACKPSLPLKPTTSRGGSIWRGKKRTGCRGTSSNPEPASGVGSGVCSSMNALNRETGEHSSDNSRSENRNSAIDISDIRSSSNSPKVDKSSEAVHDNVAPGVGKGKYDKMAGKEDNIDRTDGESSYSSFYSSFFKTESGSVDDSGDAKKQDQTKFWVKAENQEPSYSQQRKQMPRRKIVPSWMENVCVTSELIYKYQVVTKSMEEVLSADNEKLNKLEQPGLVNDQLGQLYLDLQLEGEAAKLTLEEGVTSSGSSGEESCSVIKDVRKKRQYNKLTMIYEEDAPLPPSQDNLDSEFNN